MCVKVLNSVILMMFLSIVATILSSFSFQINVNFSNRVYSSTISSINKHVIILHIEACSHVAATYKPLLFHDQLAISLWPLYNIQ